ncbi:MAG: hypothetical protein PHZ27_04205 [Candidatus Omnitrophica bacterium]|nr:hypothetical protein [Candidatus Omnitrophota bacterium]
MDKEKIEQVLRLFKGVINVSAMYSNDHPAYIAAVSNFFHKVDEALMGNERLEIGFSQDKLLVNGQVPEMGALLDDINHIFHFCMVKKVVFLPGVSENEIKMFLDAVKSVRGKEKTGKTITDILNDNEVKGVVVEVLDYSPLFHGTGGKITDVWQYLMDTISADIDKSTISERVDALFKDDVLVNNILDNKDANEKFTDIVNSTENKDCAGKLVSSFINSLSKNKLLDKMDKAAVTRLFSKLDTQCLADSFWGEILNDSFDEYTFNFFGKLIEGRKDNFIKAVSKNAKDTASNDILSKKLKTLFSVEGKADESGFYRKNLMNLLKEQDSAGTMSIDYEALNSGYEDILCEILYDETKKERLVVIFSRVLIVLDQKIKKDDVAFLNTINRIINKRLSDNDSFKDFKNEMSAFLENFIINGESASITFSLTDFVENTSLSFNDLVGRILKSKDVDRGVVMLLLKFYPGQLHDFMGMVKLRAKDVKFMDELTDILLQIETDISYDGLVDMFKISGDYLKTKILKGILAFNKEQGSLIRDIIKNGDYNLRKELVASSLHDKSRLGEILQRMFGDSDFFGLKTVFVIENIEIVESLGIKESLGVLTSLSKTFWPWKYNVAKKAKTAIMRLTNG